MGLEQVALSCIEQVDLLQLSCVRDVGPEKVPLLCLGGLMVVVECGSQGLQ